MIEIRDNDEYLAYCQEYAEDHPVYENGLIVGHLYPNGTIVYITGEEGEDG